MLQNISSNQFESLT